MDLDLVGYLFDLLDPAERERIDAALRSDAVARKRLERLRIETAPLAADRLGEPPAGLAVRTLDHIAAHLMANRPTPARRAIPPESEPVFAPSRWRRVDALIAACIVIVVGGLGVSGVGRIHQQHNVATCQNNLRQLHQAFVSYSANHDGRFPQVSDRPPNNVAAAFVPMLQQAGHLPASGVPACPVLVGAVVPMTGGYAYSLGYRGADGQLHGLRRDPGQDADLLPILADRNQPAGHRTGHNVLFIGGNVRFCTSSKVGVDGDDIFLNQADTIAAGLHRLDTVLADGNTHP